MSKYSKQHYQDVAKVLGFEAKFAQSQDAQKVIGNLCEAFDNLFTNDNPNFDRERFKLAIGKAVNTAFNASESFAKSINL